MKGMNEGMLFVPVNFAAANLPFHPPVALVFVFPFYSFFSVYFFPFISLFSPLVVGTSPRSGCGVLPRGASTIWALTLGGCCCFHLVTFPQLQFGIKGFVNFPEDLSRRRNPIPIVPLLLLAGIVNDFVYMLRSVMLNERWTCSSGKSGEGSHEVAQPKGGLNPALRLWSIGEGGVRVVGEVCLRNKAQFSCGLLRRR